MWLGTFDTTEEAASVHDSTTIWLKGAKVMNNFSSEKASPSLAVVMEAMSIDRDPSKNSGSNEGCFNNPHPLPMSVLQYGEKERTPRVSLKLREDPSCMG